MGVRKRVCRQEGQHAAGRAARRCANEERGSWAGLEGRGETKQRQKSKLQFIQPVRERTSVRSLLGLPSPGWKILERKKTELTICSVFLQALAFPNLPMVS